MELRPFVYCLQQMNVKTGLEQDFPGSGAYSKWYRFTVGEVNISNLN
jgi:hypothetical protein